jgi:glycosyltransferase involved in cell wall biosynthesis
MSTPARSFSLTPYPLSESFREQLETVTGAQPTYVSLAELRRLPFRDMLTRLRSLRGAACLLPLETADARSVLPILELVAAASRPSSVEIVGPDLARRSVSRLHAAAALASLLRASVSAQVSVRAAERELRTLLTEPPYPPSTVRNERVLYLNGNLWLGLKAGGSIGHVAGVVNGFAERGRDVTLATVVEPIGVEDRVTVRSLRPPDVFALPVEATYYRFQQTMAREALELAHRLEPGFVYQRMSVANYTGAVVSRALRVPLVLEYNGSEVWIAANWGTPLRYEQTALAAERVSLRHAHLVVTVSEALKDDLLERGLEAGRIVVHPNGVDPRIFDPARFTRAEVAAVRDRHGIPHDAVVVSFLGTFGQWHGSEVLARAIAQLAETGMARLEALRIRFLLVGDGLRLPEVRRLLETSRASRLVSYAGLVAQADAPLHLAASDILVSPHVGNADGSPFFGSPTKLFEYMAMGKAIVASRLNQIADVLTPALDAASLPDSGPADRQPELAILTEPGHEGQLAQALLFAAESGTWRERLGANARAEALARYTWTHHVDAILDRIESSGGRASN